MSGNIYNSNMAQNILRIDGNYFKDYYDGKIPTGCGEDCEDDCEIDHGYHKQVKFEPLFKD